MSLPTQPLSLFSSSQQEDASALSIIHNKNMEEIASYVNQLTEYIATLQLTQTVTQLEFNALLVNAKTNFSLLVSMNNGDILVNNGYHCLRYGTPVNGPSTGIEFIITDTLEERSTDFRSVTALVRSYAGNTVYPLVVATLTQLSIIFNDASDLAPTQINDATDPNNKQIILL